MTKAPDRGATTGESRPDLTLTIRTLQGFAREGRLRGKVVLGVDSPHALARVVYRAGEQVLGSVAGSPFELLWKTDSVPSGLTLLQAEAVTPKGDRFVATQTVEIVDERYVARWLAKAVLGPLVTALSLSLMVIVLLAARRRKVLAGAGADMPDYGYFGGAVCPGCGAPFAMHWWAPHVGSNKWDRCPNCLAWHKVALASPSELRKAEQKLGSHSRGN